MSHIFLRRLCCEMASTSPSASSPSSALFQSLHASRSLNKGLEQARYAALSTVTEDGLPACRTVVIRDIHEDRAIVTTTDLRSKKITHLTHHSSLLSPTSASELASVTASSSPFATTSLCWWFPQTKEQYRLRSRTVVVTSQTSLPSLSLLRQRTWQTMSPPARSQFDAAPPGTVRQRTAQGDLDRYEAQHPSEEVVSDNFALLLLYPVQVDYLYLPKAIVSPHPVAIEREGGIKDGERKESDQARWLLDWVEDEQRWKIEEVNP